mgnify:CR=1 FL=1
MTKANGAIDFMYYVATPEFMGAWAKAKEGELLINMLKRIKNNLSTSMRDCSD